MRMSKDSILSVVQKTIIVSAPFCLFIGQFIKMGPVRLSYLSSVVLGLYSIVLFFKKRYEGVLGSIIFFTAMILYAGISLLWSSEKSIGLGIFFSLATGGITLAFIAMLSKKECNLFFRSLSLLTYVIIVLALIEMFFGIYLAGGDDIIRSNSCLAFLNIFDLNLPLAFFINPNDLSQYLLCIMPLIIVKKLDAKKCLFAGVLLCLAFFIFLNATCRLATLSFFMLIFAYLLCTVRKNKVFFVVVGVFFSLFITGIFILPHLNSDLYKNNIIRYFLTIDFSQAYVTGRSSMYGDLVHLGLDHLLTGAGLGESYTTSVIGPHNMFLFIFSDLGLFCALGFALFLLSSFISFYKKRNALLYNTHIARALFCCLLIFPLVSSMSSANEQRKALWVFLGILIVTRKFYKESLPSRGFIAKLYDYLYKINGKTHTLFMYRCIKFFLNGYYPLYIRFVTPKKEKHYAKGVIVSLTSFPERIDSLFIVIETLLRQSYKPQKIVLWLAKSQFSCLNEVSQSLLKLMDRGLDIQLCDDDLCSHKKYYYALKSYPDCTLITVDDDTFYPENLIENLVTTSKKYPHTICCTIGHRMRFTEDGFLNPYEKWDSGAKGCIMPSEYLVPIGCEGVLYPPYSLHKDVLDRAKIKTLCPLADDLWLKSMATLNSIKAVKTQSDSIVYVNLWSAKKSALNTKNVTQNKNDEQLSAIIKAYPALKELWNIR